jgi:deazaflavin-dependent oxidoreductase (nitroreductase family)
MTASTTTRLTPLRVLAFRFGNPFMRRIAGWLPWFGILTYRGRTTGRTYRTPINVFRRGDVMIVALTYGPEVQWVKNVRAAGGCQIRTRRRDLTLVEPELFEDPHRRAVPRLVGWSLGVIGASWFLRVRIRDASPGHVGSPTPPVP